MKWVEVAVTSAVSVCVGALIPIVLIFLKERLDSRRRVVEWFESRYIEGGIDVLHEFFRKWALLSALPARNPQELLTNPAFAEVPAEAAGKLSSITGGVAFQNWFNAMRGQWLRAAHQGDWNQLIKFHGCAASMAEQLNILRRELLNHELRAKSDAYRLSESSAAKTFNEALHRMTDHLTDDPNVTKYTAEPKSPTVEAAPEGAT